MEAHTLIETVVRKLFTHNLYYDSINKGGVYQKEGYWLTLKPDRTKVGELTQGSAQHLEQCVQDVTHLLIKELL